MKAKRPIRTTITACAIVACAGCGGAQVPRAAQTDAVAAVRAAHAVGAAQEPSAAYHLELADQQIDAAKARMRQGDMESASRLLRQAEADAELSIALTRTARTRKEAEATQRHIEDMRRRYLEGGAS